MGDPLLPITNAGGFPVVHMTAPQAYIFDLKGWTCLPCLFTCYDTVNSKWGKGCPAAEVVASFPAKRRTLFRGVWHGMSEVPGINKYYEEANQAV